MIVLVRNVVAALVLLLVAPQAAAQDLGHRMLGALGSHAGEQRDAGLYVADRLLFYGASTIRDREGNIIDIGGARVEALVNAFGLGATLEVRELGGFVSFGASMPLARVSLETEVPEASLDRLGIADAYLQPIEVGWRLPHVDVVASYGIYIPTGIFTLGGTSLSSGHVTHELAGGSTVFFDSERRFRISALLSYHINHTKFRLDITRGETLQIQGGAGALIADLIDLGVAGAALWQIGDDRGTAIPPVLVGARDQALGIGAELGVMLSAMNSRVTLRYLFEAEAEARPQGHVLALELAVRAWTPESAD